MEQESWTPRGECANVAITIDDSGKPGRVQPVDRHSSKAVLIPPPLSELERLAHQSRLLQPDTALANVCGGEMRNLNRRLAPQAIEELVTRYKAGDSTPALARDYGIAKSALLQLLHNERVTLRKQAITPRDPKRAARLYESGLSITVIVEQVGYSYSTVRKSLHESGVAMRPRGARGNNRDGSFAKSLELARAPVAVMILTAHEGRARPTST